MSTEKEQDVHPENDDVLFEPITSVESSQGDNNIAQESGVELKRDPDREDTKEVKTSGISSIPQQEQVFLDFHRVDSSENSVIIQGQYEPPQKFKLDLSTLGEVEAPDMQAGSTDYPSRAGEQSTAYPDNYNSSEAGEFKKDTKGGDVELMQLHPTPGEDPTPGRAIDSSDGATSYGNSSSSDLLAPTAGGMGEPTPGGPGEDESFGDDFDQMFETQEEFDARIREWIKEHGKKEGDFYEFYLHRICCTICTCILIGVFGTCFILFPRPLELCLKFSFDDQDIENKVSGEEGGYELMISNPNTIAVDIYGIEITAYYGGEEKDNRVISAGRKDYHIKGHSNITSLETYVFSQNCTAAVPIATLRSCSEGLRAYMSFNLVYSFKACLLSFLCKENIVFESKYKSNCPEDEKVCTDLNFFVWN